MNERTHHGQDDLCVGKDVLDHSCRSLRAIIEGTTDAVYIKDQAGRYKQCNTSAARFIGKRSEDIIGQDDSALFPVTIAESIREQDRLVMADAKVVTVEEILAMPGGELRTFLSTKGPIFDQQGRVSGVFGIARDMTEQKQGERALREAHTAVELAMEGISKLDATGRYLFVNARYAALLGYQPEELVGQSWEITVHPEDRSAVVAVFNRMLTVGKAEGEFRGIRKDGTVFDKHVVIVKPQGKAEEQSGHYCFVKDITDRKVTERREYETRQLLASMTRVQSLFIDEAKPEAVWNVLLEELLRLTNSEYGFIGEVRSDECQPVPTTYAITNIAWNAESRDLSARRAPTFEFRNLKTLFEHVMTRGQPVIANDPANDPRVSGLPPGHPPMHAFLGLPFFYGGVMTGMVGIANRPGGYDETLVAYLQPLLGTCGQFVEGFRNKRLRSEAEQALRASEDRFRLIFMHEPECVKTVAPDGMLLAMNPTGLRMVEAASLEEVVGRSVMPLIHSDDRSAFWEAHCAAVNGSTSVLEFRVIGLKGQLRWMDTHSVPLREAGGTITAVLSVTRDITERKRADAALRESEERFRVIADTAPVLIWMSGLDKRCTYLNTCWLDYTGRAMEEELGDGWAEGVHTEDFDRCLHIYSDAFDRREPFDMEYRLRKADGQYGWIHDRGVPRFFPDGTFAGYLGACIDVTGRRQAETALRRMHDELEQRVHDRTTQLELANRSLQTEIVERTRAEEAVRDSELRYKLLTESTFDGVAIHDQGILIEVNAGLERIFGYEAGELVGRSIWDLIADESRDLVLANMRNGVNGPYEAMGRRKDGTTFPGEVVVRPYRYRGKDVRLVAGRDITERKHLEAERSRRTEELERQIAERTAEIAKLESQRSQTERLAALGRLAAGVAHEINNPIAGIKNAFMLVKQAVDPAHPHAEFLGMIDREIARVASIVQQMYQLYRPESGKGEPVELRIMMQDIETLFAPRLQQRRLMLAIDVDSCLHWLRVPRRDVLQVLLNLLNNAVDCSLEGGTITLIVRVEPDAIRMAVSDQGPGIPPEHLPHIFDPFFTTKTGGDLKGMGLGLSISQSLVMAMGGTIEVRTQPNGGSTFSVLLPRHVAQAGAQDQSDTIHKEVMHHDE